MRIRMNLEDYDMFVTWWKGPGKMSMLKGMGNITLQNVESAFRNQGREREWPSRSAPNVAGIIRRLNDQKDPMATDFIEMPALLDSGALRNSFDALYGRNAVVVHSTSPYADRMQRGLIDRLKLEPIGRRHLARWLKGLAEDSRKRYRRDIGWLLNKKRKRRRIKVNPHKRVMLRMDTHDRAELQRYVGMTIRSFVTGKKKKILKWERTTNMSAIFRQNVVDVKAGPRTSYFAPKGKRGKHTVDIYSLVKPKETDWISQAFTKMRFLKPNLPSMGRIKQQHIDEAIL